MYASGGYEFLSVFHVYGGPVSSALLEELSYYGIRDVLAYGLAGSLTTDLHLHDFYMVEDALVRDGTTPHYTNEQFVRADPDLTSLIRDCHDQVGMTSDLKSVRALTADAIYREYDHELIAAARQGCDIVNCDSSHLFAVAQEVGIRAVECGVVSDRTLTGRRMFSEWATL